MITITESSAPMTQMTSTPSSIHPATAATQAPAPKPPPLTRKVRDPKPADKYGWWWGTGRRKTAVARVRMRLSKGEKGSYQIKSEVGTLRTVDKFFAEE